MSSRLRKTSAISRKDLQGRQCLEERHLLKGTEEALGRPTREEWIIPTNTHRYLGSIAKLFIVETFGLDLPFKTLDYTQGKETQKAGSAIGLEKALCDVTAYTRCPPAIICQISKHVLAASDSFSYWCYLSQGQKREKTVFKMKY